jgi:hypothetical protein
MERMNCAGCKKPLKKGEFVVLNGGAMIKTKTGAIMGDKRHLGFLTIHNHFDSKKNYQSLSITDRSPNGQFEFYACSHKCLTDFLTRQIMHLSRINKFKKFETAPQSKLNKIGYEWGCKIVRMLGFKNSLITDESRVFDFMGLPKNTLDSNKNLKKISDKIGLKIKPSDYIWKIARNYKAQQRNEIINILAKKGFSKKEIQKKLKELIWCDIGYVVFNDK